MLATQEGRRAQLEDLRALLEDRYEAVDGHRQWDDHRMYPCLFVRRDSLRIGRSADRWLSTTPQIPHSSSFGSRWPKLAVLAKLSGPGVRFGVASFHLDNVEAAARPRQAGVLLSEAEAFFGKLPVFLCGDANDHPDSPTLDLFRSRGWTEPWAFGEGPPTFHGYGRHQSSRIDYILAGQQPGEWSGRYCDTDRDDPCSDHFLVRGDYTLESSAP